MFCSLFFTFFSRPFTIQTPVFIPRATSRADMLACLFGAAPRVCGFIFIIIRPGAGYRSIGSRSISYIFPERLYALYQHALRALSSRNRKKTGKPGHASQLFKRTQNNDLLGRGLRRNTEGRAGIIYQKLGIFRRTQISLPVKGFNICKR